METSRRNKTLFGKVKISKMTKECLETALLKITNVNVYVDKKKNLKKYISLDHLRIIQ